MSAKRLFVAALLVGCVALHGFADTTGSLNLAGTVGGILDITVTAAAGIDTLDLTSNTDDLLVGTVIEKSNMRGGYTVALDSENASSSAASSAFLKGSDPDNPDTVVYAITYSGESVVLAGGSAIVTDSDVKTAASGNSHEVRISYTGAFLYEDVYSDTLTFTITAK